MVKNKTYNEVDRATEKTRQQNKIEKAQGRQRKREKKLVRVRVDHKTVVLTSNPDKYKNP